MNLKLNHRKGIANVKFFNKFTLSLRFDSIADNFSFEFWFDPFNKQHAEMACVSHFHEAIVQHNGETLVTGFAINQEFSDASKKSLATIAGYSKPGNLGDCDIATDQYPLQHDGMTLREITEKIIRPFRLKLIVDEEAQKSSISAASVKEKADKKIKTSTASESQNAADYIIDLATSRDIIVSHDEFGNLLFTRPKSTKKPIFHFDGNIPNTKMRMRFNGQGIHSHITVIKQADSDGGNAGEFTVRNPYCPVAYVYRPRVIVINSGDDITLEEAAWNELRKELKNINLIIDTDRWEINNKIARPNNVITAENPDVFLYKKTEWFVEQIDFEGDEKKTTSTWTCVPLDAYSEKMPKNMFVEPHEDLPRFKVK